MARGGRHPAARNLDRAAEWLWIALPALSFLSISAGQACAGAVLLLWLLGHGRPARPRWHRGLTVSVVAFFAWIVLAGLLAGAPPRAFSDALSKWSPLLLLPLGMARRASPAAAWRSVLLLSGAAAALLPWYVWTYTHLYAGRAQAFSGGSPNLGTNLMMAVLLLLPAALASRGRRFAAFTGVIAAQLAGLVLTINRAASLGLAAGGTWLVARRAPVLLVLALGFLGAWTAAVPGGVFALRLRSLVVVGVSGSALERLSLWRSSLAMIRDRPLAGVTGKRRFQEILYGSYRLPGGHYPEPRAGHVHNSFLQTAVLHGIPGLGMLCWWLAVLARLAWRCRADEGDPRLPLHRDPALLARGLLPLLVGVLVNANFDFVLGHGGQHSLVFYALAGLILGSRPSRAGRRS